MKEELIKELVVSSKTAHRANVENQHRIESLQKEANLAKAELAEMQRALQKTNVKDLNEKCKLEMYVFLFKIFLVFLSLLKTNILTGLF